jgi:hypothetical protein
MDVQELPDVRSITNFAFMGGVLEGLVPSMRNRSLFPAGNRT